MKSQQEHIYEKNGMTEKEIEGKKFKLGGSLGWELQDKIVGVISGDMDVFASSSSNMSG